MSISKNCSPAQTQKERSEKKLVSQEKMFYSLPLGKMPTLKRLVEAAGFEGDLSASLLKHSIRAMSEATDWDLDTESRHVWGFIVRMHKLLKSVHEEALAAARRKEVRHAVGKGGDIQIEKEEPKPLDLDEMNEMASKIYKATNGGIRIFTDMYPEARETVITGGKFRTYNGQHTPSAMLTTKSGMWYMVDFGGDSEPTNAIKVYMNKTGLRVDETLRKLHELYVAKSEHEEQEGGVLC